MLALRPLRSLQRARNNRAVGHQRHVRSWANDLRLTERNGELMARIRRAAKGLAIEPLMFQKQYWIVAANRSAQQSIRIQRIGRKHHAQPWNVREDAFAALRVVDGAAGQVAANRHAE